MPSRNRHISAGLLRGPANSGRATGGFTLVELLVSIAIVATLLALLLPAIGATIKSARGFRCQLSLRSIAFDFSMFADDQLHGDRGNDSADLGPKRFRLETFQESQYGLDEFWRWPGNNTHALPDAAKNDPMRCSEVRGPITLLNATPCSAPGAIEPPQSVSYGFNLRLHWAQVMGPGGQPQAKAVTLTSDILQESMVPLAWDVDGERAVANDASPVFSAPTLQTAIYAPTDRYWFPALRHNGQGNFVFIDGTVRSSARPLAETQWRWEFQPIR